jgi:transcription termination factor NusB
MAQKIVEGKIDFWRDSNMSRRKALEYAFKVLFQVDQVTARPVDALNYLLQESDLAEKDVIFSRELIASAVKNQKEIDEIITAYASDWPLDRMQKIGVLCAWP